jgi:hypothetical protein
MALSQNLIIGKPCPHQTLAHLTDGNLSYREVPSFGRDTVRRFSANCSEMKKMAARDFENLLQVRLSSDPLKPTLMQFLLVSVCDSCF